ncbi:MAG: zeta toxin family protein [Candidatus Omnitrophica bacterium]|nr:zeta toxin family protein [Candidatus Omnitrophota bacterium]
MPKVIIFAGANGTGKSTLANSALEKSTIFINADAIKDRENKSSIESGKKALLLIESCINKEKDFSFETTMSGLTLLSNFKLFKKAEYHIIVFYLFVYPVELLVERIKERVKKGGHDVGLEDIVRRYYRSAHHFWNIYKSYSSEWAIINNNESRYRNIAVGDKDKFEIIDDQEFLIFQEVAKNVKK